jgi:spermidine synthase
VAALAGGTVLAGASAGLAVGAFLLLPAYGTAALLVAGLVLAIVAAAGWTRWGRAGGEVKIAAEQPRKIGIPADRTVVVLAGFVAGAVVPPAIRALGLLFGPTWKTSLAAVLVVILGLACAWVWIGPQRRPEGAGSRQAAAAFLVAAAGLLIPLYLFEPLAGLTARAFQAPGSLFPMIRLVFSALFVLPVSVAAGIIVVTTLNRSIAAGLPRTRIHLLPATAVFGAAVGLVVSAWILVPAAGLRSTFIILMFMTLGTGALLWLRAPAASRAWRLAMPLAALAAGITAFTQVPAWSPGVQTAGIYRYAATISSDFPTAESFLELRRNSPPLRFRQGRTGTVSVERGTEPGREGLFLTIDGTFEESWSVRMIGPALVGHTGLLLRPELSSPPDVLLVGLGAGITARSVLRHEIGSLTIVEPERAVIASIPEFFELSGPVLEDDRVELVQSDPRGFWTLSSDRFDVILSRGPDPWLLRGGIMHTREFFHQSRRHLRLDGIQVHRVPIATTSGFALASVMRAFLEAYPEVVAVEMTNWDFLLIGSERPWKIPMAGFRRRFREPQVLGDLTALGVPAPNSILGRFVGGNDDLRLFTVDVPALTDRRLTTVELPRNFSTRNVQNLLNRLDAMGTRILPYLEPFEDPGEQGQFLYGLAKTLLLRGANGLVREITGEIERLGFHSRADWLRGQLAFQAGDRERAFALWEGVLKSYPEHLDSLMSLGGYYQDFGLYHAAEPYLEALETAYPERALALFAHGKNLYFLFEDGPAELALAKVVDRGGADLYPSALFYLGMIAKRNARTEDAADYLIRFLEKSYARGQFTLTEAEAHLNLAEVYRRLDDPDLAEQHEEAAKRLTEGLLQASESRSDGS